MGIMIAFRLPAISFVNLTFALLAVFGVFVADMSSALAQNRNCTQIAAILRGIENNEMYASFRGIQQELQSRQRDVNQAESGWLRNGCQQAINAGQSLSGQCQSLAQTITLGRQQIDQLASMAREGQNLAQNREQLVRDYQRYNCAAGGEVAGQGERGNLLNNMFGGGYDYVDTPYDPWSSQQTRRTVCVRTCDGFYWPISFSTTDNYISQDAISCHEMCPGTEVALFSYRNPGETPEDMISLSGASYRSMPYAFRFREEVDTECSCQTRETVGTIEINPTGNVSLAQSAPPAAEAIYVPLPRPRPREDGTAEAAVAQQPDIETNDMRIVDFGDKRVRIVGPQTPYVPAPAEES